MRWAQADGGEEWMRAHNYGDDEEASYFPKKQAWLQHEGVTGVLFQVTA